MNTERAIVQVLIAALVVAAVYDLFVQNKGAAITTVVPAVFKGVGGIFARITGSPPPAGY